MWQDVDLTAWQEVSGPRGICYGTGMSSLPNPVWPVVVLALISLVDAILCIRPARFISECLEDVKWPRQYWWMMPVIKFAAAGGLIAGIWIPGLGLVTSAALVFYFVAAVLMHVRARDFGRNLFVNATGMLITSTATLLVCFLI